MFELVTVVVVRKFLKGNEIVARKEPKVNSSLSSSDRVESGKPLRSN